jgi:hypothetical protein
MMPSEPGTFVPGMLNTLLRKSAFTRRNTVSVKGIVLNAEAAMFQIIGPETN